MKRIFILFSLGAILLAACGGTAQKPTPVPCVEKPVRGTAAEQALADGAVAIYERLGEGTCTYDIWVFYPDGRIIGDNYNNVHVEKQVTPAEIITMLEGLREVGFWDPLLYSTYHQPCNDCYAYYVTVKDNGEVKEVSGVDGGTDTRKEFWLARGKVSSMAGDFTTGE